MRNTKNNELGELGDKVLQRSADGNMVVRLADVFNLLTKGGTKYIRREAPHIQPETVALGRAWLIAARPDLYDSCIASQPSGNLRFLVDENLPPKIIPIIRNLGNATHTNFTKSTHNIDLQGCGVSGKGDRPVWEWAVNNDIDAIITGDRAERDPDMDLTRIAKDHAISIMQKMNEEGREIANVADLPVIVHIRCKRKDYRYLSGVINGCRDQISDLLQTCVSPVIVVDEHGARNDITYVDLWKKHLRELDIKLKGYPQIPRRERQISQWWKEIACHNPVIPQERRDEIMAMLVQAADVYKTDGNQPSLSQAA